jgi:hypothetical protein
MLRKGWKFCLGTRQRLRGDGPPKLLLLPEASLLDDRQLFFGRHEASHTFLMAAV